MVTPFEKESVRNYEKVELQQYLRFGKILLISNILLCISLILPYIEGQFIDSAGSEYPFQKDMFYNGIMVLFNAITSEINYILIFLGLSIFLLIIGSIYHFLRRRKLFHHPENQAFLLRNLQWSLMFILISDLMIFISIALTLILGLPPSLDPENPLDFNYIFDSEGVFYIYERLTYGIYVTSLISLIIIIIGIVKYYYGYRLTSISKSK